MSLKTKSFDSCQKCSLCNSYCPVQRVEPSFPGPKYAGPELARLGVAEKGHDPILSLCTNCKTCDAVCPSGIEPSALILSHRKEKEEGLGIPLRERILGRAAELGRLASLVPGIANAALGQRPVRYLMAKTLGIDHRRNFPRYARQSFKNWFAMRKDPWSGGKKPIGKVAYFYGCNVNYNDPELGRQAVEVLEHNGFQVVLPPQRCCGLPLLANGDWKTARAWASYNLALIRPYIDQGLQLVFTSTSCALMVKFEYSKLLKLPEDGEVTEHAYDISEFLLILYSQGRLAMDFGPLDETLPYHLPCHLRYQGIGSPALELLRLIPQAHTWDLDAGCCGMAGTYGFKQEKYNLSMEIGRRLFNEVRRSGVRRVVTDCETCRWQIEEGTGARGVHPVTVLWEAYGGVAQVRPHPANRI